MPKKATWWNYFVNRMAVDVGMGGLIGCVVGQGDRRGGAGDDSP